MSERITTAEARREFSELVNRVAYGKERVTITRHGKEIATIIPIEDAELLGKLEDQVDIAAARKALKEKGSISLDELVERGE